MDEPAATAGPPNRSGSTFGPYELRTLIGRGGMGEVYEAYDTSKDRVVALKLLPPQLALDSSYQERFRRESRSAARLSEPHIVPVHDWGEIDGVLYIDMRLVRGKDLRAILRADGPLPASRAVAILAQVAEALDAAHADGLVHRDIKPENVLVTPSDFAYLVDFGIAHASGDAAMTMTGTAIGSYAYMAPERFEPGAITGSADVYSLTCVLHECITGVKPFESASMSVLIRSHISAAPPRPSIHHTGIPPALDAVIARGMAKTPGERYPTAGAFAAAAQQALHAPVSEPRTSVIDTGGAGQTRVLKPAAPHTATPRPADPATTALPAGPRVATPPPRQRATPTPGYAAAAPSQPRPPGQLSRQPGPFTGPLPPQPNWPSPAPLPLGMAAPPAKQASRTLPILLAVLVAAVLAAVAFFGWYLPSADSGKEDAAAPVTPPARQTTTAAPKTVTGAGALPSGAIPCPQATPASGPFTQSATGSAVTSCPFAEEVRKAYAAAGPPAPQPRSVAVASPATGQRYTLSCALAGSLITCRGEQNAVVYIY